tara:strand:+ start:3601 stop:4464 length:864 start_codon:yes stop_codon:yes gene_type:complete
MTSKIICIAPDDGPIEETILERIQFQISDVRRSDDGRALCILTPQTAKSVNQSLEGFDFDGDILVLKGARSAPQLLICDMDSTIVESETLDDLAASFDLQDQVAAITERAMRGEMDFHTALNARVEMLKGLEEQAILDLLPKIKVSKGAEQLVRAAKKAGAQCLLVSGGFTHVTGFIAERLGFDAHYGNRFIIEKGVLTGKVMEPIQDKSSKLKIMDEACEDLEISHDAVMAIGDGANDIPMLEAAGYGIAYHAKPIVRDSVPLQINHTDLSAAGYIFEFKSFKDKL